MQLERLVPAGLRVEHVQRRDRLTIGGRGEEAHVAGLVGRAVRPRQRDDVGGAVIPAVEGRHLPHRVGGEQLGQLVQVVVLEGRDVLGQQLGGLRGLRRQRAVIAAGLDLVELRPGSLQQAVDRGRGRSDRLGHFGGLPLQDLAEHQHRTLPWGQVLQSGDERQAHRFSGLGDHRGIRRILPGRIRQWLQPGDLVILGDLAGGIRRGGAQASGQRPALAAFQGRQAGVGGDPVQPRPHRRFALETVVGPPGSQVGLLDQVLGVVQGPGHPVTVRQQLAPEALRIGQERFPRPTVLYCHHAHVTQLTQ